MSTFVSDSQFKLQAPDFQFDRLGQKRYDDIHTAYNIIKEIANCEIIHSVNIHDGKVVELHQSFVRLTDTKGLVVKYDTKWDMYFKVTYIPQYYDIQNLYSSTITDIRTKHTEPNRIGKMNAKKLHDWINYWQPILQEAERKSQANKETIFNFETSLADQNVEYGRSRKTGSIYKGNLEFKFIINHYGVDTEIILRAPKHDLETFLKMSDNKIK